MRLDELESLAVNFDRQVWGGGHANPLAGQVAIMASCYQGLSQCVYKKAGLIVWR